MKRDKLLINLLATGLDSDLSAKALDSGYNLTKLRNASKTDLEKTFSSYEIGRIQEALQRSPIDKDIVGKLIAHCDWACCLCWNLDERQPVIIHHIEEHAKGGSDKYENLVVLCLNHHGMAHSKWDISRHPTPPDLVRQRKREFEKAIKTFKAGKRAAPGREGNGADSNSLSDVQALKDIAQFFDRPAFSRPFKVEGNMRDFLGAIQ